jgi:hypothetical protein
VATRRRWVLIAFGVAILVVFIGIGAVIGITAWVQQNVQVDTLSEGEADQEFVRVRTSFAGRAPLLEMREGRPQFSAEKDRPSTAAPAAVETLNVLAWDPREEHLARVSVPFWVVRMKSGPFRLNAYASGLDDRVDLRIEDIEKYGHGIILDTETRSGGRVLLWTR